MQLSFRPLRLFAANVPRGGPAHRQNELPPPDLPVRFFSLPLPFEIKKHNWWGDSPKAIGENPTQLGRMQLYLGAE